MLFPMITAETCMMSAQGSLRVFYAVEDGKVAIRAAFTDCKKAVLMLKSQIEQAADLFKAGQPFVAKLLNRDVHKRQ